MKQAVQTIGCFGIACIVGFSAQRFIKHSERQHLTNVDQSELRIKPTSDVEEKEFASAALTTEGEAKGNHPAFYHKEPVAEQSVSVYTTSRSWDISKPKWSNDEIPREAYLIRGWSLFHVGEYEDAAQVFEKLYKTQADSESAQGIVASLRAGGDMARLDRLATEWGGTLAAESYLNGSSGSN